MSLSQILTSVPHDDITELDGILQTALLDSCVLANARAAKMLAVRNATHADLSREEFARVISQSRDFIVESEIIAGQMISPLRGALAAQVSR